ncbi:MAG: iron-containing alcohol dehydrogenase [Burkholderiaceae bacterium]|nr:iron-containing alcohol dehydrogenase [Burkholderiaceae bacterium]
MIEGRCCALLSMLRAVISDPDEGRKYVVADTRIVPRMIYHNLPRACDEGLDLHAREQMALASMYAGQAFTRANVGNVHALAHQLGGRYHTPHGLANAILLPPVLRWCASRVTDRLATLALRAGVATENEPVEQRAQAFVESVDALNQRVGIPRTLADLREADIPDLARAACREADANYPVPRVMSQPDAEAILREVLPIAARPARKRRPAATPPSKPSAKPVRVRKPRDGALSA